MPRISVGHLAPTAGSGIKCSCAEMVSSACSTSGSAAGGDRFADKPGPCALDRPPGGAPQVDDTLSGWQAVQKCLELRVRGRHHLQIGVIYEMLGPGGLSRRSSMPSLKLSPRQAHAPPAGRTNHRKRMGNVELVAGEDRAENQCVHIEESPLIGECPHVFRQARASEREPGMQTSVGYVVSMQKCAWRAWRRCPSLCTASRPRWRM